MQVSVVIVSYKVPYHLLLCLESLETALNDLKAEIIVVDNASGDDTANLVAKHFPKVKYIQNQTNDGFSKANNKAINLAKGEYICLVNPDTVISETCIFSAIHKHQNLDKCGILGVQLMDGTGHFLPESKINRLSVKVAVLKMLGYSSSYYNNRLSKDDEGETATLVGAFMCFRKQDYQKLEGLDERYFMYGEDIDLSFQFTKAGFQNYYLGKESIIHFKGESTLRDEMYFKRFFESVKLFFTKHYTNSKLIISIMQLFFVIAKRFKKSDMSKKDKPETRFNQVYLIGQNQNLVSVLESNFSKDIQVIDAKSAKTTPFEKDCLIFDLKDLSIQNLIDLMKIHRKSENIFRIKPKSVDVLIGSDSSTSQGKIVNLNEN